MDVALSENAKRRASKSHETTRGMRCVCGESSKVCRSGFSGFAAFVANPQRNFPIFVAGDQQPAAGKLDQRKTKRKHSHTHTHTLAHTRPRHRHRIFRLFRLQFFFFSFYLRSGRKFAFHMWLAACRQRSREKRAKNTGQPARQAHLTYRWEAAG